MSNGITSVPALFAVLAATFAAAESPIFHDAFNSALADRWSWVRENSEAWRIQDGALEIRVEPGNLWGGANDAKNVLVRPVPETEDAIVVSCIIENKPTSQYEQANLVWYYDDSHMVKIGIELVHGQLSVVMGREENDSAITLSIIPIESTTAEFRLNVRDGRIHGQYRFPGESEWREGGKCDLPVNGSPNISLQAYQGPSDAEHWARFDDLRVEIVE